MSRHLLSLWNEADRKRARQYIEQAPAGTRVELKAAKRSIDQNSKLWAMLSDVSVQHEHHGRNDGAGRCRDNRGFTIHRTGSTAGAGTTPPAPHKANGSTPVPGGGKRERERRLARMSKQQS